MKLLCKVKRGNKTESEHEVSAIVIDEDGKVIFSSGKQNMKTYIRSCLKPFQAAASIHSGAIKNAGFNKKEIALMCASHNGEEIHVKLAKNMAKKLKFNITDYECGTHPPYDAQTRLKRRKESFTPFHNNCSGKHSGMLAISKHIGSNNRNYIFQTHPVQKVIFTYMQNLIETKKWTYGIDGCSAPTPYVSLKEIAILYQLLAKNKFTELEKIYNAMIEHPYIIAGRKRFDTDFNDAMKGRGVTKVGGEAIRGMVIKTSNFGIVGIAAKVIDGGQRANEVAIMKVLNHLNLLKKNEKKKLIQYEKKKIYNHQKQQIGHIEGTLSGKEG